jgi:hypothetical protein
LRKLTTILLACLLAFNWFGYRLLDYALDNKNNAALQKKLDKQEYDPRDLVEVRIPLNMPYISDWKNFESYEGDAIINGDHYRYVKRKLCGNELILLCIPNRTSDALQKAGNDFFKQVNDLPTGDKKSKNPAKPVKTFWPEYTFAESAPALRLIASDDCMNSFYQFQLPSINLSLPGEPPNS